MRTSARVCRPAAAVALLLVLGGTPALANEESQALSARGLIELNAGRTQEALALFQRAVAADPSDVTARYQLGATRAKLGDYTGAIGDLRAVLAADPKLMPAALELGAALVETGEYQEAETWLLQAQRQANLEAQASFFLGLAQLRLGRLDSARENFARAGARDPSLALSAQYYEGVIAYRQQETDRAETLFNNVVNATPDSAIGRESVRFLENLRSARRATYSAFGAVALEYDSNVTLGPSTTVAQAITGQADGRFVITAGGRYVPWTYKGAALEVSYEFFQSLHFDLTDFNLMDNRPAIQLSYDFGRVFVGLLGRYDYYLLGAESFLSEATVFPWLAVREDGIGQTQIYYRMQRRDYKNATTSSQSPPAPFQVLDGFYNFAGVRQVIDLGAPGRQVWLGYQLGLTNPVGDQTNPLDPNTDPQAYRYGAQQVEVALRWPLPYEVLGEAGYRYEFQAYGPASALINPDGDVRQDNDHRLIISFERPLPEIWDHLFVNAAYFGTWNDSSNVLFEYNRQIGSIGAEVRF
jgi:tetratricopeptide (TPR) repeat protein